MENESSLGFKERMLLLLKRKRFHYLVIVIALEIALLGFVFSSKLYSLLNYYQYIPEAKFQVATHKTDYNFSIATKTFFQEEFGKLVSKDDSTVDNVVRLREAMLNLGQREKGGVGSSHPKDLWQGMKKNRKLLCGNLAQLHGYMLDSLGFSTRIIVITRSLLDPWDSHVFVEVWDESRQKWFVSDPTFNFSFRNKTGDYLSALEVYNLYHGGKREDIEFVFGKETSYQYSLADYRIHYFSLMNHVTWITYRPDGRELVKYPPFKLLRPIGYIQSETLPVRGYERFFVNLLSILMSLVLPFLGFLGFIFSVRFLLRPTKI